MKTLSAADVIKIHDAVIYPGEIQGLAGNKSIESVLARINNRIAYGMINDVYELAACYACYIAAGHALNDANKRTAFGTMQVCLIINGVEFQFDTVEVGNKIRAAAQSHLDESELSKWLWEKIDSKKVESRT